MTPTGEPAHTRSDQIPRPIPEAGRNSYKDVLQRDSPPRPWPRSTPRRQDQHSQWESPHRDRIPPQRPPRWVRPVQQNHTQVDLDGFTVTDRNRKSHQGTPRPRIRRTQRGGRGSTKRPTVRDDGPVAVEVDSPRPPEQTQSRAATSPTRSTLRNHRPQGCVRLGPSSIASDPNGIGLLPLPPPLLPSHNPMHISDILDMEGGHPPLLTWPGAAAAQHSKMPP
jgi:hypothetical protein